MDSYDINKYSLELILYSLRDSDLLQIDDIRFSDCTYPIGDALMYIAEAFSFYYQQIIPLSNLRSLRAEQFISYALPICLKLSKIPTNFNILLAFSFLIEIVTSLSDQYNCFRFLDAAKKCLVVIIKRKIDEFGMWNTLTSYCRWTNENFLLLGDVFEPIDVICPTPYYKDFVLRKIDLCDVSDEAIYLTSAELSFLAIEDILDEEKENIEPESLLLSCSFCGETCELFAHCAVNAHLHYTRSINVDVLQMHARLFRVLTNNTPATQDRRILFDE